jgi:hypothetical protein
MNNVIKVDFTKNKNKRNNKSMIPGKIILITDYLFKTWFDDNWNSDELLEAFEEEYPNSELASERTFVEFAREYFEDKMTALYHARIESSCA